MTVSVAIARMPFQYWTNHNAGHAAATKSTGNDNIHALKGRIRREVFDPASGITSVVSRASPLTPAV